MTNKIINSLYDHYKNTPKKLKIVCDWDEVIRATEPYALWLALMKKEKGEINDWLQGEEKRHLRTEAFIQSFQSFWKWGEAKEIIEYSPYGSGLKEKAFDRETIRNYNKAASLSDFYHQIPFLTMAKDLLKLIKEDKVEKLIFLSTGDERKKEVFGETFAKLNQKENNFISLRLLSEEMKTQPIRTKADWVEVNVPDYDIFIDDNPNICESIIELANLYLHPNNEMTVFAPHYPAIENQHRPEVLLIKTSVSDLKKEDFS